ncbi:hypothetical protein [Amycolatopsis sp. CB00013]|uniref:hypothetical protein n=1 Tax=Amycolatopsis sp. CB00013 TaxID=1703945 RepID=UPI0011611166|nr:hypothetical protein [Amycolatopsis sp. CB00013]
MSQRGGRRALWRTCAPLAAAAHVHGGSGRTARPVGGAERQPAVSGKVRPQARHGRKVTSAADGGGAP